jgi:hypothetical protein
VSLTAREEVQFQPLGRRIIGISWRGMQGLRGRRRRGRVCRRRWRG